MPDQPFLDDPREQFSRAIAAAVESPLDEVRALHLKAAEHYAQITRDHRLPFRRRPTD